MTSFRQYVAERQEEDGPGINGGLGDLSMSGTEPDETLLRIAKLVIKDHKNDFMSLATHLAKQNQRIRNELETYHHDSSSNLHSRKNKSDDRPNDGYSGDGDEVVPSSADSDSGTESEG